MKIRSIIILMLIIFSSDLASAKKPFRANGYYISKSGDTIHGYLKNRKSKYLIVRTENGKRKKFTPSKIKGFNIDGREYIPMHLKEFNTNRYVNVRVTGYCTLYVYEHINKYKIHGMGTVIGGAVEAGLKSRNSGLYIKKDDDENCYSVPAESKLLKNFLIRHFGDNTELIAGLEEMVWIDNFENMVITYNAWHRDHEHLEK